jgi:hypothetical protein
MSRTILIVILGICCCFPAGCSTLSSVTEKLPWVQSQKEKEFREQVANDPFPRAGTNSNMTIQKFNP